MNFFSDPSHLWLAVLVMAGTGILCTGVFVFAVKVMLGRFFAMAQSMLERATIQANSIDLSMSLHSQRLTAIDERVTKLEKHRHDHANYLAQLDARVSMSRGAP